MSIRNSENLPPLSLHDSLALGEVELGLMVEKREESEMEEMERLPVLLRLLSSSRPFSSVPKFPRKDQDSKSMSPSSTASAATLIDEVANQVVASLEDVAATYSVAEGVDVVACHLAPSICKNVSKLSPLKRKRGNNTGITSSAGHGWDTAELAAVGANPRSSFKRRRQSQHSPTTQQQQAKRGGGSLNEGADSESSADEDNANPSASGGATPSKRRASRRSSEARDAGSEDLLEVVVSKTLSDLSSLVVASLEPLKEETDIDGGDGGDNRKGKLSLKLEDSALAEPARSHVSAGNVGVMVGSDLGSTVVSLCHFSPVLRQLHVANALCRANIPQTAGLVKRLGANSPSGVPTLLRGCIDAYKSANVFGSRHTNIAKMATSAIAALASLSDRESSRIRTVLQQESVMVDLQLQLALKQDPMTAMCLLVEHLSSTSPPSPSTAVTRPGSQQTASAARAKRASYSGGPCFQTSTPDHSLLSHFKDTPSLLSETLALLQKELALLIKSDALTRESGRLSLLFRSYTWLVLKCDIAPVLGSVGSGNQPLLSFLAAVMEATTVLRGSSFGIDMDVSLGLMLSSLVLTIGRVHSLENPEPEVLQRCQNCVESIVVCHGAKFGLFASQISTKLQHSDVEGLLGLVSDSLDSDLSAKRPPDESTDNLLKEGLSKLCESARGLESLGFLKEADPSSCPLAEVPTWLQDSLRYSQDAMVTPAGKEKEEGGTKEAAQKDLETRDVVAEGSAQKETGVAVETVAQSEKDDRSTITSENTTDCISATKQCLRRILCESRPKGAGLYCAKTPNLIVKATEYLGQHDATNLPIVSPLQLEINAGKVDLTNGSPVDEAFLYQVLYWFAYIDSASTSLVRFDVRCLPLKELLTYCQWLSGEFPWTRPLQKLLEDKISKHCPEIEIQRRRWEVMRNLRSTKGQCGDRKDILRRLSMSLKASLTSNEQGWVTAERDFLIARAKLRDADVFPCVASALLASPNTPPPYCTYAMLYHDPLVFVRSPMRVWQTVGLRRLLLTIMSSLLDSNDAILLKESPRADAAHEAIASRNVIAVRCVLAAVSGSHNSKNQEHNAHVCSMTAHFIRKIMAKGGGLAGTLVRQSPGLPDGAIDWLVEFVPETMADSKSLVSVFERGSSLTTRLSASAAIVRFAIAHGHQQEDVTEKLVYAALAQLVSSFFLVVGPVGVPVSVLVGEDSGVDVADLRSSTFRVLRALVGVRGRMRPALRTECGLALNKLAGYCKGENLLSGLSGSVVSRRKALLRDIYDHIVKACNSMAVVDSAASNLM